MFSIFNTLHRKYHLWGITEKHGFCSCIVFSSPFSLSLSHRIQTHLKPILLLSPLAWHKRGQPFPTHHLERVKINKDSECHLTMQYGENSFCHCCHSEWDYSGDPRPILPLDLPCIQSLLGLCSCIMNAPLSAICTVCIMSWFYRNCYLLTSCSWWEWDAGVVLRV